MNSIHQKVIFFLTIFLCSSIISFAQKASNVVNLQQPDKKRLELLTFNFVNDLRLDKKLPELTWDEVLLRAARDHADYLLSEEKISHYQNNKEKRTPSNRVKIHGGIDYTIIGENIVEIPLGVQFTSKNRNRNTVTYESASKTMALAWKASPNHYKNIISDKYKSSALAVAYDEKKQRLIAVQVFGFSNTPQNIAKQPDISKYLLDLETPELPFKLKKPKYKKKHQKPVKDFFKLEMDRGRITGSYKKAKKIFKGRRSGFAQEFIPKSQYDSASTTFASIPNRRNGLYELNGELRKPVYRRQLLKFSRNANQKYLIYSKLLKIKKRTTTFIYPLSPNFNQEEFNVFLIKNKRIATFRSYISIPWSFFDSPFPNLKFVNNFTPHEKTDKYIYYSTFDTLNLRIHYQAGKVEIDSNRQFEIKTALQKNKGKIIRINASAYASIEGDKASNKIFAEKRMKHFITLVQPWLDSISIKPAIQTKEQWRLFQAQIKDTSLDYLKEMPIDKVRRYINQHQKDSLLAKLLAEQRYSDFELIWRQDYKEIIPTKNTAFIYDSLLTEISNREKPKKDLFNSLEQAQLNYYYDLIVKDSIPEEILLAPYFEKHPEYTYHELVFKFTFLRSINESQFLEELHEIGFSKYFPYRLKNDLIFNNLIVIYNKFLDNSLETFLEDPTCYQKTQRDYFLRKYRNLKCRKRDREDNIYLTLKAIPKLITFEKQIDDDQQITQLWKYYYLYLIKYYWAQIPINPKAYGLLPGFKRYFHPVDSDLSDEERLRYALFYSALKKYNTAKALVEPLALRDEPHIKALKLYVCLKYSDFEHQHDFTNYLITQFPRLGEKEWCDLWNNPEYLNFILLEDLRLKNFYNCNCDN